MLKIEHFSKTFDKELDVLNDVSFDIKAGEFVVVLGPSGSGKTTLLRSINGLVIPDRGTLHFKGEKVSDHKRLAELRRNFGMIFQHYNLVENLSVINNVLTGALAETNGLMSLLYLFPERLKIKALESLERVQLIDKAYEITGNLSGGQKQRIGIARAIMQEPSVLLADEPISNLDPIIAYDVMSLLKDICTSDNISVLCNLHQVDFALQFADRIICLVNGEVVFQKPVGELTSEIIYQAYKN